MTQRNRVLIAAVARNGIIGYNDGMPWHVPADFAHFKATTMGGVLIMGRTTVEGMGRLLPGRRTIVLSRNPEYTFPGAQTATSLDDAFAIAGAEPTYVAGGRAVYEQAFPYVDHMLISRIPLDAHGDTSFPAIPTGMFELINTTAHDGFDLEHYVKSEELRPLETQPERKPLDLNVIDQLTKQPE